MTIAMIIIPNSILSSLIFTQHRTTNTRGGPCTSQLLSQQGDLILQSADVVCIELAPGCRVRASRPKTGSWGPQTWHAFLNCIRKGFPWLGIESTLDVDRHTVPRYFILSLPSFRAIRLQNLMGIPTLRLRLRQGSQATETRGFIAMRFALLDLRCQGGATRERGAGC
jgi:hypothetical protein